MHFCSLRNERTFIFFALIEQPADHVEPFVSHRDRPALETPELCGVDDQDVFDS